MRLLRGMHSSSCYAVLSAQSYASSVAVSFARWTSCTGLALVQIRVGQISTNTCRRSEAPISLARVNHRESLPRIHPRC